MWLSASPLWLSTPCIPRRQTASNTEWHHGTIREGGGVRHLVEEELIRKGYLLHHCVDCVLTAVVLLFEIQINIRSIDGRDPDVSGLEPWLTSSLQAKHATLLTQMGPHLDVLQAVLCIHHTQNRIQHQVILQVVVCIQATIIT